MAVAIMGDLPGVTAEMDAEMTRQAGISPTSPPRGFLARMAGPIEGGWRIIGVWESQEIWEAFKRERLEPYFRQIGREMPNMQVWQLETFFTAPQSEAGTRS